jgi:5'-nucleotidase (lipoprotein e(P4) family)
MSTKLAIFALATIPMLACDNAGSDSRDAASAQDAGKADGATGVDIINLLAPGTPVNGKIASKAARLGHIVFATAGTSLDLEVTRAGSSKGLDTVMTVHGPRTPFGYNTVVASDDDSGHGPLSRLRDLEIEQDGFYLVEIAVDAASPEITDKSYRLALDCDGNCVATGPVVPTGNDVRWAQLSAEYRAASLQTFAVATAKLEAMSAAGELPEHWAISTDADETILSNLTYQRERAALGTEYSSGSWAAWVARREATAMPGAAAFLRRARELGGMVAVVTNRRATTECPDTEANLEALGLEYDLILCRTNTSDKNPRFAAIEDGSASAEHPAASLVMFVGDNILDFPGLTQEIRHEGDDAFADFGDTRLLVPNPMYGSWTSNG